MILYPAIDIAGGRAVRLKQGRFEDETVYRDNPVDAAVYWTAQGARWLHVVDLDGARLGKPVSLSQLTEIAAAAAIPIQYGGGLRSISTVDEALQAGASRVVVGTAIFRDEQFLEEVIDRFGDKLAVAIDVRGGVVATAGWTQTTTLSATEAIKQLQQRGAKQFVYTDADRDGMMVGPDLSTVCQIVEVVSGDLIYSGGIEKAEDLQQLAALRQENLSGVIVGKALYEKRFTINEGQAILDGDQ
jgi:phosphoribosylformimino-5-aminoimidazole carboxamide ribotide isomerase